MEMEKLNKKLDESIKKMDEMENFSGKLKGKFKEMEEGITREFS